MKTAALVIGKHHSSGFPGKNYRPLLNRPVCWYPIKASRATKEIQRTYVSTDSPNISEVARTLGCEVIDRAPDLSRKETPTEFVFQDGYNKIRAEMGVLDCLCLLFANSVDVRPSDLSRAIEKLQSDDTIDSVVSGCRLNMFTPLRARKLDKVTGISSPLIDIEGMGIENTFDRDAMGDVYFYDFAVQVVRPERCLLDPLAGALPFRWLGKNQRLLEKDVGFDIDEPWQLAVAEDWLLNNGFTASKTPY